MKKLLSLLIFISLFSCAQFPARNIERKPKVSKKDLTTKSKIAVEVNYRWMWSTITTPQLESSEPYGPFYGIDQIEDFQICNKDDCSGEADYIISLDHYLGYNSNILAVMACVFTLGIIPAKEQHLYYVKGIVIDKSGKVLKKYDINDHIDVWTQILFLPYLPFAQSNVRNDVSRNLVNEVIRRAVRDKVI